MFIKYLASDIIILSSNPSVGPSPKTAIYYFLLSVCADKLLPAPKLITFLPNSPFDEKFKRAPNPIP